MEIINALNWRYATKRMNGEKVPQEKIEKILDATRLSASSMGLQPYTILLTENQALKKKIQPAAFNQPQIVECSHLLIFAAWADITEDHIDEYLTSVAATREIDIESLADFRKSIMGSINGKSKHQRYEWAARQAYIAFGTAIVAAASEKVDATPMEGFDPVAVDEILGLEEKGLRSITMLALGYRDEKNDFLASAKKVRRKKEKLILKLQ